MELPDSIKAVGEQVGAGGDITPTSELFEAYPVFAAEVAQLFTRPWLAVDHVSRLAEDGDYFRAEVGSRSVVLVREAADRIHALRNACLHAGYRVCEEESGRSDHLFCQYHGWSYALDGKLTDPLLRPELTDRSRFRLPHYAMRIERGLILVDLSAVAPEPPEPRAVNLGTVPDAFAAATVAGRKRYSVMWNWKYLRQLLWTSPELVFGGKECGEVVEIGPLSFVALRGDDAALVRLTPRFPGHSDVELVRLSLTNGSAAVLNGADPIDETLRQHGDRVAATPLDLLDRHFYEWYWPLLAPTQAQ
jgi:nitrite reductase/ring-hydroxylating ferredoxin subunit